MTKHTKGKWKINQYNDAVYTNLNNNILFERPHGGEGKNNFEANANLIAAAPELLEALKNIENDDNRIPKTIWDMRNKAIQKAEGAE